MSTHLQMHEAPRQGKASAPDEERRAPGRTARGARGSREERLARARAALGVAERTTARHGGRIDRTAFSSGGPTRLGGNTDISGTTDTGGTPDLGGPTGIVGSVGPGGASSVGPGGESRRTPTAGADAGTAGMQAADDHSRAPLPPPLAPLTPYGSLRAGSTVAIDGSCSVSLMLAMAAAAAGEDGWCALAGMPDLGLRAARDAGLDLERLAIAPATAVEGMPQLPQVLSALVDGVGVLVLGPRLRLTASLWRSLTDRARAQDTLVLAAAPVARADLHLRAEAESWEGLGRGTGRLRRRTLRVSAAGRGIPEGRAVDVVLPEVHGLLAAAPAPDRAAQDLAAPDRAAPDQVVPAPLRVIRRAG
ncbi:hypothetical protein [Brachybacterium sp. ACRRE]|uniref:hypothetical protein n=1 Tax=Brachybacterium sp. ACRRE TaxID=2918184 RepID=UPI001EF33477|nr:hypothetical protein [Brachybacterium sp. ACRRE]MCG7309162.1 hypothetical protein [Brachybacterium sp. ACRRE]